MERSESHVYHIPGFRPTAAAVLADFEEATAVVVVAVVDVVTVADKDKLEAPAVKATVVKEAAPAFAEFEEAAAAVASVEVVVVADKDSGSCRSRGRSSQGGHSKSFQMPIPIDRTMPRTCITTGARLS
jgi:hypothetical protein